MLLAARMFCMLLECVGCCWMLHMLRHLGQKDSVSQLVPLTSSGVWTPACLPVLLKTWTPYPAPPRGPPACRQHTGTAMGDSCGPQLHLTAHCCGPYQQCGARVEMVMGRIQDNMSMEWCAYQQHMPFQQKFRHTP